MVCHVKTDFLHVNPYDEGGESTKYHDRKSSPCGLLHVKENNFSTIKQGYRNSKQVPLFCFFS